MDKLATLSNGNEDVTMTGTLQCPIGEAWSVEAQAIQGHGRLFADAAGEVGPILCTGALQTWSVTTSQRFGAPFQPGPATGEARVFLDGCVMEPCSQTVDRTISLH